MSDNRKFMPLYTKNEWRVGYFYYKHLPEYKHVVARIDVCAYSGIIVKDARNIPQEVKEVYYFWSAMLEQ
jgi:Ni,Fe-hydrogenase III small subunit